MGAGEVTAVDVAIIGGGIMGAAIAYALSRSDPTLDVVVIEPDPTLHASSTARSAGGVRQQFSTPENIALSQVTVRALSDLKALFGPDADLGFREQGYLSLASAAGAAILEQNVATQRAAGASTLLLAPEDLTRRFPWLATDDIAAGSFGPAGEGWIDPMALHALLKRAAIAAGIRFRTDAVTGLVGEAGGIGIVSTRQGGAIRAGHVVVAAGGASHEIAAMAGVSLPVVPRKRYVYVLDCKGAPEGLHAAPLTVDPSGVWFRPEGRYFICGRSPDEDEEPPAGDLDHVDHAFFESRIWPELASRVPAFEAIKVVNAWAGHYDYNTLDQNAVIGRHPEIDNLLFCCGFSGHGLQQAIGAGQAIAELIAFGGYRSIDLTRFGYERIRDRAPLFELNVI